MVINKKIKRTMLESKSQYLGSLLLIILSCLLFTMFNLLSINLSQLTSAFERDYRQEDVSFVADRKLTGIGALESRLDMDIEESRSFDYPVSPDSTLRIFRLNTKVDIPAIIEGKALSGGDILIDPSYARANKLKPGGTLEIYGRNFNISGIMSLPNYIYPLRTESDLINDPSRFGIAVIGKNDFDGINRGGSFYTVRFNGDRRNLDDRISLFKDSLKNEGIIILSWTNITDNPRVTYVTAKLAGINEMSSSMPAGILLLTCILTGIVMWRMLKREAVITGTLYALGYKKRDIMKHYLLYPLAIALSGGIMGTILGAVALRPMIMFYLSYFNMPAGSLSYNVSYIIISILLPVIFLIVCSYFVINKSLENSPVELMRGGREKARTGLLERRIRFDWLRFTTRFKIREQLRSIPRSVFLLLGIVMATMLLLMGFLAKSSMDYLMKDSFDQAFKYNYQYVFNSVQHGTPKSGEAFSEIPVTLESSGSRVNFAVYGVIPDSRYIYFEDKSGNVMRPDKIIITRPLADKLGIKPGDTIKVVNRLDSKEYGITIDGIAETYVGQYIYMPLDRLNAMMGYPPGSYMGLWSTGRLDIAENRLLAFVTVDDMRSAFDAMTKPLQAVIGTIAFMSFIIGLIVIYVVTSLTIEENKTNISLMKILGYRKKEVYSLILNSYGFLVVLGYILGVPLLFASMRAMFDSVTKDMSVSFPIIINYTYVLIGFVVIYLTFELSKLLSRRKINRISMAEALKAGME